MRKTMLRRAAALIGAAVFAAAVPALSATPAAAADSAYLRAGQRLDPGASISSGESRLVMQGDGNLVLYLVGSYGQNAVPLWASGTYNNWGAYAVMQADGNFVIYRQNGSGPGDALWSSGTWGSQGAYVQLLDGSFYVNGSPRRWESGTGHRAVFDRMGGLASGQYVASNSVWLVMQLDGNLVLYRKRDGAGLWSTGTWRYPGAVTTVSYNTGELSVWRMQGPAGTLWSNHVTDPSGATPKVQDDGNFVLYNGQGRPIWASGTYGNW
ncbi:hypothetical protein ACWCYY_14320 [Kitasatospora sp. NPDC001664]